VKRVRLQNSWLHRRNNPASNEARDQETSTFDVVKKLLAENRIRQYDYRQLIVHLTRKCGYSSRGLHVRYALKLHDDYGVTSGTSGMKKENVGIITQYQDLTGFSV
jgi:hypothetical protein